MPLLIHSLCVISGPLKRFDVLQSTAGYLETGGYQVLKPEPAQIVDPSADFVTLTIDAQHDSPRNLELGYLEAVRKADFHLTWNANSGQLGLSTAAESAFAILTGTPSITVYRYPSHYLDAQSTGRPYPGVWFSDEVTLHEQAAIERHLSGAGFAIMVAATERERVQELIETTTPLPRDHPDFLTLSGLVGRLLTSLPALNQQ